MVSSVRWEGSKEEGHAGIRLTWHYDVSGILLGAGSVQVCLLLLWKSERVRVVASRA